MTVNLNPLPNKLFGLFAFEIHVSGKSAVRSYDVMTDQMFDLLFVDQNLSSQFLLLLWTMRQFRSM
jgi:hypothetical protein